MRRLAALLVLVAACGYPVEGDPYPDTYYDPEQDMTVVAFCAVTEGGTQNSQDCRIHVYQGRR